MGYAGGYATGYADALPFITGGGLLGRLRVPVWSYVLASTGGEPIAATPGARTRRLTVRLTEPSDASFTLSGADPDAQIVEELTTDLIVYRDGLPMFRGRVGPTQDSLSPDVHTVSVTALDYRELLNRRILYPDPGLGGPVDKPLGAVFGNVDQEEIGWVLILLAQAQPGGNLGIVRRAGQLTGRMRDRTYEAGKSVGEALFQLAAVSAGFDWDIDTRLAYRVWYPQRGQDSGLVLEYGSTVSTVSRTVSPGDYANAVYMTGSETTAPQVVEAANVAVAPEGRWDRTDSRTDIRNSKGLAAAAEGRLAAAVDLAPSYTVTLAPGVWQGPSQMWLGDAPLLVIRSGRLTVQQRLRVHEISFDIDDNGAEQVQVTLGRPPLSPTRRSRRVESRLGSLERR